VTRRASVVDVPLLQNVQANDVDRLQFPISRCLHFFRLLPRPGLDTPLAYVAAACLFLSFIGPFLTICGTVLEQYRLFG
ncbi:hypothetical protein AAVH_42427, partial [Aphelenchoides avenae]